ncbi:MAG: ABC transporter ATP-binding protein [Micrococcales bacterium]
MSNQAPVKKSAERLEAPRGAMGGRPGSGGGPGFGAGMPTEKSLNFGPSAKRLVARLRPERTRLIAVIVLAVASVALNVLGPWMLGNATNVIFNGAISAKLPAGVTKEQVISGLQQQGKTQIAEMLKAMDLHPGQGIDFAALTHILVSIILIYLGAFAFGVLNARILNVSVQNTIFKLRRETEAKLHRLPLSYFDTIKRGELLSRVTNDIDNVSQTLQQTLSQVLVSLFTVLGVLVMMFTISPVLALVALVTIPATIGITMVIGKRSQKLFVEQWAKTGQLNAHIEESFTGHALVKVFGRSKAVEAKFGELNQQLYQASFGAQFVSGIIMPTMMFIGNLAYVAIAVIGGLFVSNGSLSLGGVQSFIQYSRQFNQPLAQLGSMANLLQSGVASAERVFELLDAPEQSADPVPAQSPAARTGTLTFENVQFGYTTDAPLITGLNLSVEPGQTVAIVGPTGAGKTTLVNLILRFYELNGGRITLDGVDIASMSRDDLRSRIGMVLQDTWLFKGTIRENILYGNPQATEEQMVEAAKATYVDRFVRTLPAGYDTVLDDEASNVSAGEKQLITIARAFLSQPTVLILDEATSSVDTRTELLVQRAMAALRADRTSFVIAHRLSTIRDADLILVMENGSIVEQGNHQKLIAAAGPYSKLYQSQFEATEG